MNAVYQLFATVRERLLADLALQEALEKRVYFNLPERPTYPCVVFSVDEVMDNNDTCRITFNLQLLSAHQKGVEPLKTAQRIAVIVEEGMQVDGGIKMACRRTSMTISLPAGPRPHAIQQSYQAMIWRGCND